jgi:hypothetical protein
MSAGPDGGADFEIEHMVCRCAAPVHLADKLQAHFAKVRGLRVRRQVGPSAYAAIELSVREVQYLQIKSPLAARQLLLLDPTAGQGMMRWHQSLDRAAIKQVFAELAANQVRPVAELVMVPRGSSSTWMPVFDVRKFVRTGAELYVASDLDADQQLDALAPALDMARGEITVKPPPGWNSYGHPALWPPSTPRRR